MINTITLQGIVPSKKNSKRRIQRGHHIFMVPSQAHEDWHADQLKTLPIWWPQKNMLTGVSQVELVFYAGDKRKADLSNKAESVMDLLVDTGVIEDDNWFVIPELLLKLGGVDKDNPRCLIKILT